VVRSLEACNASFFIFIKISIFTLVKINIAILDRRKAGSLLRLYTGIPLWKLLGVALIKE